MRPRYYKYAGLRVVSEIPLPEWKAFEQTAPGGDPDVVISLGEVPDPGTPFDAPRVVTPRECRFAVPGVGFFRIRDGREIIVAQAIGVTPPQLRPWLIGSAWGSLCYQRGLFLLHASAVMVGDAAVLFCAPPKGGKSTIAAQLNACGYPLVSDDVCRLDIPANGVPMVHPSAPRLKLWSDTLEELGWGTGHLEPDQARAGKFHVVRIANTHALAAPVRAIYLLEWGNFRISRLSGLTALRRFLPASTYRPGLLGFRGTIKPIFQSEPDCAAARAALGTAAAAQFDRQRKDAGVARRPLVRTSYDKRMSARRVPGIDEHSVISGNSEIAFTRLDDDLLAMDENAGYCYSLNVSAARIWGLISTPTSVGSICAVLCREFAVDPETCLQDVFELLDAMRAAGLVKVSDAAMD